MGSIGGLFFCVAEIGGFFGPTIIGAIKDMSGSFFLGNAMIAGLSTVIGIIAFVMRIKNASEEGAQYKAL